MPHSRLETMILAALERATAEGRYDTAELLLQALEALCTCAEPGSPRAEAHLGPAWEAPPSGQSDRDAAFFRSKTRCH